MALPLFLLFPTSQKKEWGFESLTSLSKVKTFLASESRVELDGEWLFHPCYFCGSWVPVTVFCRTDTDRRQKLPHRYQYRSQEALPCGWLNYFRNLSAFLSLSRIHWLMFITRQSIIWGTL